MTDPSVRQAPDPYAVIEAMTIYGGSFTSALAHAWQAADPVNRATLQAAFPKVFAEYGQIAAERAAAIRMVR